MPSGLSLADIDRGHQQKFGLNLLRAFAIVVVIFSHSIPLGFFDVRERSIVDILDCYDAVLFIMISGALLLPVTGSYGKFLGKRLTRVWIPFALWSIVYALLNRYVLGTSEWWMWFQFKWFWVRPTFGAGWFVPAITAIYFFYPILSPWLRTASRSQIEYFLFLWFAAGALSYLATIIGEIDYSLSLLATFYGMTGYAVAGFYFIRFPWSSMGVVRKILIPAICVVCGILLPFYYLRYNHKVDVQNLFWSNFSLHCMALGCLVFMLMSPVKSLGKPLNWLINFVSRYSYGMYLTHMLVTKWVAREFFPEFSTSWLLFPLAVVVPLIFTWFIRQIPVVGKYIVG